MGVLPELFASPARHGRRTGDVPLPPPPAPPVQTGYAGWPSPYKAEHAPPGGVTVQGKHYPGGQFIPAEVMAKATPAEKAAVEGGGQAPPPAGSPAAPAYPQGLHPAAPPVQPPAGGGVPEPSSLLTPEEAELDRQSQAFVKQNYQALRAEYLKHNATVDPAGNVRSVTLNTDEWRSLIPGYTGTNSGAVHEASSWANKQLTAEMMNAQRGKGNNRFLVLAGGGGSGKGTATGDFFTLSDYPLVLDQVSDRVQKLEDKLDEAKALGYEPEYTFVDRMPEQAWGGVVGRALNLMKKGQPPRTVPIQIALKANIEARKTALDLILRRPDIPVNIIDNDGGDGKRRLIVDRNEAVTYLRAKIARDEQAFAGGLERRLTDDVLARWRAGEIPEAVATGLLGRQAIAAAKAAAPGPVPGPASSPAVPPRPPAGPGTSGGRP